MSEQGPTVVPPPVHPGEACAECDNLAVVKRLTWSAWYGFCAEHDPERALHAAPGWYRVGPSLWWWDGTRWTHPMPTQEGPPRKRHSRVRSWVTILSAPFLFAWLVGVAVAMPGMTWAPVLFVMASLVVIPIHIVRLVRSHTE